MPLTVLALAGCTLPCGENIKVALDAAKEQAAQLFDERLEASEFWICTGASVGAVRRQYWQDEASATAWQQLCNRAPRYQPGVLAAPDPGEGG